MKIKLPKNENSNNAPTNYVLISDSSGSMWGSIDELKQTVAAVTDLMTDQDTLTVGDFSGYGDYQFFIRGLKKSQNIKDLINKKLNARGLTCYVQSLAEVPKIIDDVKTLSGNDNFAFYFLSDGHPNDRSPESEILKLCRNLKGKFQSAIVCGYGSYYNRSTLLNMADAIGGQMNHISDFQEMQQSYTSFLKGKKTKKNIKIDKKYDIVWQVGNDIIVYEQNKDNSVDVFETKESSELFGIDESEIDALTEKDLQDGQFVYSLAYVLSQRNKANLGVSVLRKAKAVMYAKMLQKAFTVNQKGRAENELKTQAVVGGEITKQDVGNIVPLTTFVKSIKDNLGQITIDLDKSEYNSISRKGTDVSKVKFETDKSPAVIVGVTGNENRANISFLTVRKGKITEINDSELQGKLDAFNKTAKNKITLPIESETYRNYTLVANGDFNFEKLAFGKNSKFGSMKKAWNPEKEIDLFDEDVKTIKIGDFVSLYKTLIKEKAHASVLRMYIKKYAEVKHLEDLRETKYGRDAIELLKEIGLDYAMRYAPKSESIPRRETDDFIPFLCLEVHMVGAATISASKSYEKFIGNKKPNVGDAIVFPYFEKYDQMRKDLDNETFIQTLQTTLEGIEKTVDLLRDKVSSIKFYLMTTNSWFSDIEKIDKFEYDGLQLTVKEEKEYVV